MDISLQALVMGIVQGLTEFLPISSSGHLIIVPSLLGWNDPFIDSLQFSVVLHMGTLLALLAYFWRDWLELVPAGLAAIRDRSMGGDPRRRLAVAIVVATIPAAVVGVLLNDVIEQNVRHVGLVAVMLVVGGAVLWLADRWSPKLLPLGRLGPLGAFGIGAAQAVALVPGISRSGISIAAGLFLGLDRESAARFSFLMAAPIIAGAGLFEGRKLLAAGVPAGGTLPLAVGFAAAALSGVAAIAFLMRYLRSNSMAVFVAYRLILAAIVFVALLAR